MSPRTQRFIFTSGVGMIVGGLVFAQWGMRHFSQLVNYQRVSLALPLFYGVAMMYVDTLANWSTASSLAKVKAGGIVFCAVLLTVGALFWLLVAPEAQATP